MENKFDTQFLIEGHDLDEDAIHDGILNSAKGDCLLVVEGVGIRRHPGRHPHHHHRKHGASVQRPARLILFKMFKVSSLTFFSKKVRNPR